MKQIVMLFLLILIGFQSIAQDSTVITLNQVLVTAVRADKKTPVTQKTIGDESLLEAYHGQEIPMLLGSLPSIYSNSDGGHAQGYSYFSLRGINQPRINMTLNGVPLNEPEDHGVYTSNMPSFINSIQSIQIQRGVGTSTNGSPAFVGSINFQSKSGLMKGTELQFGGGSYNTGRFNFSTASGLTKNKFAYFLNVGGVTTDGFRENSGSRGGTIFLSVGHFGKKQITKLTVFSGLSKNQMAWEGTPESVVAENYKANLRGNDRPDLFNQTNIQLQQINIFNPKSKLTTTLFFNNLKGEYDVFNLKDVDVNMYYANENQHSNWVGLINQYDYKILNYRLSIGLSVNTYRRNHRGVEYYSSTTSAEYQNSGNKAEASGFIKLSLDRKKVTYYVDVNQRYVDFKYRGDLSLNKTWNFFNPKVGAKYFVNPNLNFYTTIGLSHREPTRSVLLNGGLYLTQLNDVKPERVIDYELGLELSTAKIKLQTNLYLMTFKDEIIPAGPLGSNSLPIMINVPKSLRTGLEVDLEYTLVEGLIYAANTNLSYSEFGSDHKRPLFSPTVMFNQGLSLYRKSFSFNINHSYFSKSYIDITNENTVPSYSIFGANIGYEYQNIKLMLQGNNLTSLKYYCNGYAINGTKYLFANALANYYLTLRVKL